MTTRASLLLLVAGGFGCGEVLVDITQRDLILDPVETVTFDVDIGGIEVLTFGRNGISLFYYMVGSLVDIGDVGHRVDGDTLDVFSVCEHDDFCRVSWYAEIMPATALDIRAGRGAVKVTGADASIVADVRGGGFEGVALAAPTADIAVEAGDVSLEWLVPPEQVAVELGEGNVAITLPPGSYRCELATDDGEVETTGVLCDEMATATIHVEVELGDITLSPGVMP